MDVKNSVEFNSSPLNRSIHEHAPDSYCDKLAQRFRSHIELLSYLNSSIKSSQGHQGRAQSYLIFKF